MGGPGGARRTQEWPREEKLRIPGFPGEGSGPPRGVGEEQVGMGQRAPWASGDQRRRRGASGDSREVPRPLYLRPPPPAGLRPTSPPPGDGGSGQVAGRRWAARALQPPPGESQLRSGPAGLGVTCALPPVPGDHGLAGDGVQPGGALRLLAAGVREGAETGLEWGRGRSRGGRRGTDPARSPLSPASRPLRAPAPSPALYLMKKTRPPRVIP